MSEFSDRIRRENERSQRLMIERLEEANLKFDADVEAILRSRDHEKRAWSWRAKVAWYCFAALVLYACILGILSL
jgi:hypothetical protein